MLNVLMPVVAFLAPTSSHEPAQDFPPAHLKWTIEPIASIRTIEWICQSDAPPSVVKISVRDVGESIRAAFFAITLDHLLINGQAPASLVRTRVDSAFSRINNIGAIEGMCRGKIPVLEVRGSFNDGKQYHKHSFTIDLQAIQ